ncbi:MAG: hypothetical protein K2O58_06035 [Bacteroidales bacterium]|nr:hypothetical protein [Bacteroidales bacterium]
MALSDLSSRRIGIVHLVILGITLLTASLIEFGWRPVMLNAAFNLLTVLLLWLLLHIYSRLRKMRLSEMAGGGDLAFLLAMVPYFEPYDYVLFLVVSSILTLATWWASGIGGQRCRDIPLVTGMGACLGIVIIYRTITVII